MTQAALTKGLQSRGAAIVAALLLIGAAWLAYLRGIVALPEDNLATILTSPDRWIPDREISLWCALALNIGVALLMVVLNGIFSFIRSLSIGYASLFLMMLMAVPDDIVQLNGSTIMLPVILLSTMLLFSCYANPMASRRIFLLFFLLSTGVCIFYAFVFTIPLFLIGMLQMRIMKPRPLIAALLGIITPWWLLFGSGAVNPQMLSYPEFTDFFTAFHSDQRIQSLTIAAVTVFIAFAAWTLNFPKLITYNAKTRAMNGFVSLTALASMVMMCVDYSNFPAYLSPLICFTAYIASHYIAIRQPQKGYLFTIGIFLTYIFFYIWRVII